MQFFEKYLNQLNINYFIFNKIAGGSFAKGARARADYRDARAPLKSYNDPSRARRIISSLCASILPAMQ
jgi:hypothetical protein